MLVVFNRSLRFLSNTRAGLSGEEDIMANGQNNGGEIVPPGSVESEVDKGRFDTNLSICLGSASKEDIDSLNRVDNTAAGDARDNRSGVHLYYEMGNSTLVFRNFDVNNTYSSVQLIDRDGTYHDITGGGASSSGERFSESQFDNGAKVRFVDGEDQFTFTDPAGKVTTLNFKKPTAIMVNCKE